MTIIAERVSRLTRFVRSLLSLNRPDRSERRRLCQQLPAPSEDLRYGIPDERGQLFGKLEVLTCDTDQDAARTAAIETWVVASSVAGVQVGG